MAEQYSTYKHTDTTDRIIKCFYDVYNTLGYGFLEKVYETALMHEMMKCGLFVEKQKQIKVYYDKSTGELFEGNRNRSRFIVEFWEETGN
jgi:GxxExxY protein